MIPPAPLEGKVVAYIWEAPQAERKKVPRVKQATRNATCQLCLLGVGDYVTRSSAVARRYFFCKHRSKIYYASCIPHQPVRSFHKKLMSPCCTADGLSRSWSIAGNFSSPRAAADIIWEVIVTTSASAASNFDLVEEKLNVVSQMDMLEPYEQIIRQPVYNGL